MGFDSPIIFPQTSITPATKSYSGTCNNKALPFTMPVNGNVRRLTIGNGTGAVALLQAGFAPTVSTASFIYSVNNGGSVSVISVLTNIVIATIPVGAGPYAAALTPDGKYVYVTNTTGGTVSVIATATNTVIATVGAALLSPQGIAISPDGLYCYVQNSATISVITIATNLITTTIAPAGSPRDVAVSPDGTLLFISQPGLNSVAVYLTATNALLTTVPVGTQPIAMAITPDGRFLYVTNSGSANLSVINTANFTVVATIAIGLALNTQPQGLAINPAGTILYLTNQAQNFITAISTVTNTIIASIPVAAATAVTVTPDGAYVYYPDGQIPGHVSYIATATNQIVGTVVVGNTPVGIAATPIAALLALNVARINSVQPINGIVTDDVPYAVAAGVALGVVSNVLGPITWTVEIEARA